jgi:hypothetical protein
MLAITALGAAIGATSPLGAGSGLSAMPYSGMLNRLPCSIYDAGRLYLSRPAERILET